MDNNWLRRRALESIYHAKSGHPGGVLSCIDILECLFSSILEYDLNNLDSVPRDHFILSKGHGTCSLCCCCKSRNNR